LSISSQRAYSFIKQAILSGKYKSGERLLEDIFANELEISRTPVRDALRRLHAEQLVIVTPYSGARVASWTEAEMKEANDLRIMLESYAASLAASKRTDEQLEKLESLCHEMEVEAAKDTPSLDFISERNVALHRTVVESAANSQLSAAIEPLWNYPRIVRKYGLFGTERLNRSLSHHREILEAIKTRDPDWASAIMRLHILAARSYDTALLRSQTDEN
jgi:DNA-binding GntR family transcriptional regulator